MTVTVVQQSSTSVVVQPAAVATVVCNKRGSALPEYTVTVVEG